MKTILIAALALAMSANANAGLTGTQIKQIMAWNDRSGFIYVGPRDLDLLENGHPIVQKIMLFYRATDETYACCATDCPTVDAAQYELIGSTFLSHLLKQLAPKRHSSGSDY
jgi:hypothetical protein